MADLCPDCGAPAIVSTDNRLYCQGRTIATPDVIAKLEKEFKQAAAWGIPWSMEKDKEYRMLMAARTCGKVAISDGNGGWKIPGYIDRGGS